MLKRGQIDMMSKVLAILGIGAIALVTATGPCMADEPSRFLTSRWGFNVGGFAADLRTDAQLSFGSGLGTLFRLEDATDYTANESVLRADGFVRFGKRHAFEIEILQINREAMGTLDEDLEILDRVFTASFESAFDMTLTKGAYKFSFQNNGTLDAGLIFGLSVFDFGFEMAGDVAITDPNGMTTTSGAREETNVLAPIPSAGMFVDYAITPRFATRARAEFFSLSAGELEGRFIEVRWTFDYLFTDVFGVGGGYSSTDLSYSDLDSDPLKIDYRYSGLIFYLSFVFGSMPGT
jgi:hypothetical protein